jgi:hypothetical protein
MIGVPGLTETSPSPVCYFHLEIQIRPVFHPEEALN